MPDTRAIRQCISAALANREPTPPEVTEAVNEGLMILSDFFDNVASIADSLANISLKGSE